MCNLWWRICRKELPNIVLVSCLGYSDTESFQIVHNYFPKQLSYKECLALVCHDLCCPWISHSFFIFLIVMLLDNIKPHHKKRSWRLQSLRKYMCPERFCRHLLPKEMNVTNTSQLCTDLHLYRSVFYLLYSKSVTWERIKPALHILVGIYRAFLMPYIGLKHQSLLFDQFLNRNW